MVRPLLRPSVEIINMPLSDVSLPSHAHSMTLSDDGTTLCVAGKDGVKAPSPALSFWRALTQSSHSRRKGGQGGDRGVRAHPRRAQLRCQRRLHCRHNPILGRGSQVSPEFLARGVGDPAF